MSKTLQINLTGDKKISFSEAIDDILKITNRETGENDVVFQARSSNSYTTEEHQEEFDAAWVTYDNPGLFSLTTRRGVSSPHNARSSSHKFPETITNKAVFDPAQTRSNDPVHTKESVGPENTKTSTAVFSDDAAVVKSEEVKTKIIPDKYTSVNATEASRDLMLFLSKPAIIASGTLESTDNTTTFSWFKMPNDLLFNKVFSSKLSGYSGLRATMVFRIVINGQRFQQGRYMLCYVPLGGANAQPGTAGEKWMINHAATLKQRTVLPHVEIDINCDTSAELRVPYSSSLDFWPISQLEGPVYYSTLGALRLFPYVSINGAAGADKCTYTIWGHLEDVELVGQNTPLPAFQSADIKGVVIKKKDNSEVERERAGVGPISSMAFKIAKASSMFNPVPFLGQYSSTLSWAADIVGNAASVFGWSAPNNLGHAQRVTRSTLTYATNVNKVDQSFPLSLDSRNQVSVFNGFSGSAVDEMDFSYLMSIPCYHSTIEWLSTADAGDQIAMISVHPRSGVSTQVYSPLTAVNMGPMAYLTYKFSQWRGGITYKFKLVKTEFHSGRISISYVPNSINGQGFAAAFANTPYYFRDIIDIRETNEFTLTMPYMVNVPYLDTNNNQPSGLFVVHVIDKLVAPPNVISSIQLIVEDCAAPDFEVAVPFNRSLTPVDIAVFQSADTSSCSLFSKTVGNTKMGPISLEPSLAAVGEKIMSLRSLVKKFFPIPPATVLTSPGKISSILPYAFPYTNKSGPLYYIEKNCDLYGELCSIYALSRGGVRIKAIVPEIAKDGLYLAILEPIVGVVGHGQIYNSGPASYAGNSGFADRMMMTYNYAVFDLSTEGGVEVQIPQYSYRHSRSNAELGVSPSTPYQLQQNIIGNSTMCLSLTQFIQEQFSRADIAPMYMRAGADDLNFGSFVCIPPMIPL